MKNVTFNYGYHKIFIVPEFVVDGISWTGSTYSHVKMRGVTTKQRKTCEQCIVEILRYIDRGEI